MNMIQHHYFLYIKHLHHKEKDCRVDKSQLDELNENVHRI